MLSRRDFLAATAAASSIRLSLPTAIPVPSPAQLAWQRDEIALFFHFGVNTFTDREWGDGHEDPSVFNPVALDTRQWAAAARAAGARSAILTAKHHDGFCLWPTATTTHSVARSPWRGGQGNLVREFVDGCRAEGIRPGLYLSPWDRNHVTYGDSPRYNDVYAAQLTELLTGYGDLAEVWFDGANGEGPNGRKQEYDWARTWALVRKLQPSAVIFSDAGPDVRWCGNETGNAGDPNWSTIDPSAVPFPGASGNAVMQQLQHGDPRGTAWRPAEVDVSIRPGWFHHDAENEKVRSAANLVDLYCSSVGRNGKLLLNVPPARTGLLDTVDVIRLREFHEAVDRQFGIAARLPHRERWRRHDPTSGVLEQTFSAAQTLRAFRLSEPIASGQRVTNWRVDAEHDGVVRTIASGETIGYARIERFAPIAAGAVRLEIVNTLHDIRRPRLELFA